MVSATNDYGALDFHAGDAAINRAVAYGSAGDYAGVGEEELEFRIKQAGGSATLYSFNRKVEAGQKLSLLAYTTGEAIHAIAINDAEAEPTAGNAKLRVFNASNEAGSVDVYVTDAGTPLNNLSPNAASIVGERFSAFGEYGKGNYRIRVTGSGDKADLRLDLPSVPLTDKQVATLVLTTTPGGTLVHGLLVTQQGAVTNYRNQNARVRLVAGVGESGLVAATLNGVSLSGGLRSPTVGNYLWVPAGPVAASVRVNDVAVAADGLVLTEGSDVSLSVLGNPNAPGVKLVAEDNRPPGSLSNAKIRLMHGVVDLNSNLTLTADYSSLASDVDFSMSSMPAAISAGAGLRLEVSSPAQAGSLYLNENVSLQAGRVYTMFMLGSQGAPVGVLRRDR